MTVPRPIPRADPVSQGFWDAAARRELAIQRCRACGTFQHPPRPLCRACGSTELGFERVSGEGRLWSWTTTHHEVIAGFAPALPYLVMVIELAEQPGLYMLSDCIGRDPPPRLEQGMKMRVTFPASDPALPQFEPAA